MRPSLVPFPRNNKEEISQHFLSPILSDLLHAICFFGFAIHFVAINLERVCVYVCVCVASVDSKFLVFVYLEMFYNHS